jgi:hypothetical protein
LVTLPPTLAPSGTIGDAPAGLLHSFRSNKVAVAISALLLVFVGIARLIAGMRAKGALQDLSSSDTARESEREREGEGERVRGGHRRSCDGALW